MNMYYQDFFNKIIISMNEVYQHRNLGQITFNLRNFLENSRKIVCMKNEASPK